MRRTAWAGLMGTALLLPPSALVAQLWEVHVGGVAGYGTAAALGTGTGALVGLAPGRLAYAGLRWTRYAGSTTLVGAAPTQTEVRSRAQVYTVDLSLMIPAGALEVLPGVGFGAASFRQDSRPGGAASTPWQTTSATEFFASPGVAAKVSLGRFALIPEVQYSLATQPRLSYPAPHNGLLASVRVVMTFEIDRIRQ